MCQRRRLPRTRPRLASHTLAIVPRRLKRPRNPPTDTQPCPHHPGSPWYELLCFSRGTTGARWLIPSTLAKRNTQNARNQNAQGTAHRKLETLLVATSRSFTQQRPHDSDHTKTRPLCPTQSLPVLKLGSGAWRVISKTDRQTNDSHACFATRKAACGVCLSARAVNERVRRRVSPDLIQSLAIDVHCSGFV